MRVFLIGCEYSGKTTLISQLMQWIDTTMGGEAPPSCHDHFLLPEIGQHSDPEQREKIHQTARELLETVPGFIEQFQRYQFIYHLQPLMYRLDHFTIVDWYYADVVYGPLYFPQIASNREWLARYIEHEVKVMAPDIVLVRLTAAPETIRQRMQQAPHPHSFLQEQDVEEVLRRFDEVYAQSLIDLKFTVDTTDRTIEETFAEFLSKMETYLQPSDRQKILVHQALHR